MKEEKKTAEHAAGDDESNKYKQGNPNNGPVL